MASEDYQVISNVSEQGEPLLGNCRLLLGDLTAEVEFRNGRSTVRPEWAHLLYRRGDVEIIGYDPDTDPFNPDAANPASRPVPVEEPAAVEAEAPAPDAAPEASPLSEEEREARVAAAEEALREEGLEVPDRQEVGPTVPEGFSMETADGEPRCLAAKGDGTQCANVADPETHACGIAAHAAQVAERAA